MNKNTKSEFKDAFKGDRLTASEKASMRSELLHFMQSHRAPQSQGAGFSVSEISVYVSSFARRSPVPVFLVLALLVGASTSYAAKGALPGSALYPVKVGLNEKVESALALSPAAKAEVETSHTLTRLSEVEQLKQKGKLTPEASATIQQNLSENVGALNATLARIHTQGNSKNEADITGKVEADLTAHLDTLVQLSDEDSNLFATSSRPLVGGIVRALVERRAQKDKESSKENQHKKNTDTKIQTTGQVHAEDALTSHETGAVATTTIEAQVDIHTEATKSTEAQNKDAEKGGILKQVESLFRRRHSGENN